MTLGYTGFQDNLEVILGWRDLDVVCDAIKEYKEKWKSFDKTTENTFTTLLEILKEQEKIIPKLSLGEGKND